MARTATVLCFLVLGLLLSSSYGAIGDCIVDNIPVQQNFDMNKYMGKWYEYQWLNTVFYPMNERYKDVNHYYVPTENGTTHYFSARYPNNTCFSGHRRLTPTSTAGKYLRTEAGGKEWPYWIIDTDYTQYAFVYGCYNVSATTRRCNGARGWVLSRTQEVPQSVKNKIPEVQHKMCLPPSAFLNTVHTHESCEMPKMYKKNPGQNCQVSDVQVQESFQIQKFRGLWYEIRWMTQSNVPMSEVLKNYQQEMLLEDDGKMTVYSRGRLTSCVYYKGDLNPNQTPGKFTYISHIGTAPYPHWVIATDYDNYAITYGCMNIGSDGECAKTQTAVWSRRPELQPHHQHRANTVLQSLCVNPATFTWTPHDKACSPYKNDSDCQPNNAGGLKETLYILLLISTGTFICGSV